MTNPRTGAPRGTEKRRITLERTFDASIEDVWDLWTTKEGIESWWGPEGFEVTVLEIDLRPGGELRYAMTAKAPAQIEFMKKAGMPLTTEARLTYTEVGRPRRLSYDHLADFVPGVEAYSVSTTVELHPSPNGVKMVLTFDAMHDEAWTERQTLGHESQLRKLASALEATKRERR